MGKGPIAWIFKVSASLSELVTVAMMLLITAEVICRSFLGFSLLIVDELAGYFLVAILFLGVGASFRSGSLLRVEFVFDILPLPARRWLDLVFDLMSLAFVLVFDYALIRFVLSSYERDTQAPTLLATPLYIPQIVMPLGISILALVLLVAIVAKAAVILGWTPAEDGAGEPT